MRFRLLRRRLTISAPRMAVRSAMPWPLRWIGVALVLGFCAAIGLWAFEFGKSIAGIDGHSKEELVQLRAEVGKLREEQDKAQSITNTSSSLLIAEKTAIERLGAQIRTLEAENRALRDDLGFFQRLMPTSGNAPVAIRGLQAEVLGGRQLKWQVLADPVGQERARVSRQAPDEHERNARGQALDDGNRRRSPAVAVPPVPPGRGNGRPATASRGKKRICQGGGGHRNPGRAEHQTVSSKTGASMFGNKGQPPIKSLIAHGSRIEGNLTFTDGLRIDGEVFGNTRANAEHPSILVISEAAVVQGEVHADHVIINGTVRGTGVCRRTAGTAAQGPNRRGRALQGA